MGRDQINVQGVKQERNDIFREEGSGGHLAAGAQAPPPLAAGRTKRALACFSLRGDREAWKRRSESLRCPGYWEADVHLGCLGLPW